MPPSFYLTLAGTECKEKAEHMHKAGSGPRILTHHHTQSKKNAWIVFFILKKQILTLWVFSHPLVVDHSLIAYLVLSGLPLVYQI